MHVAQARDPASYSPTLFIMGSSGPDIGQMFDDEWISHTSDLCKILTYRESDLSKEEVNRNIIKTRTFFETLASETNSQLSKLKLTLFQWCTDGTTSTIDPTDEQILGSTFWVLGFRFGSANPERKYSVICHLDTVPAIPNEVWDPFDPVIEPNLDYPEGSASPQDFLMGRGCVDDKGPAISAFLVARALAVKYDTDPIMNEVQFEVMFDTSEESNMSYPHYVVDQPSAASTFGIVFDAFWNVFAEKGGERPVFSVDIGPNPTSGLYVSSLVTAPGNSTNTIPDWAEAEIKGDREMLILFAQNVENHYKTFEFPNAPYNSAPLTVTDNSSADDAAVVLRTDVVGAQHGSAPEQNRERGANPLVSLANFLSGLAKEEKIGKNAFSTICEFNEWMWGTNVFGEAHDELYKFDNVFTEGNGTTYAVTKVDFDDSVVNLRLDIRYAIKHHIPDWEDWMLGDLPEGQLDGEKSVLEDRFKGLAKDFNDGQSDGLKVAVESETLFSPDIRQPDLNPNFEKVERAFSEVMCYAPPRLAIGGGTDAKGITNLLAVGPLFDPMMGPPINYHGIRERAPIADMKQSTMILMQVFENLFQDVGGRRVDKLETIQQNTVAQIRSILQSGRTFVCQC